MMDSLDDYTWTPPYLKPRIMNYDVGEGKKFDNGKPRWDLLPLKIVEKIVEILTFGAEKYDANNWQNVEPFKERYFAALLRHIADWQAGEIFDKESGKPHLAHAACCLIFLMWGEENEK